MRKFESTGRVVLDSEATGALKRMCDELKADGSGLQLNYSKLASWIINRYLEISFDREKEKIKKAHFSPKGYMRSILQGAKNEEEIERAMKETIKMMKKVRPRRTQKVIINQAKVS